MFEIRDKRDLELAYMILESRTEALKQYKDLHHEQRVIDLKRNIRAYLKKEAEKPVRRGWSKFEYGADFYRLCEGDFTEEEADEIFNEYEYIEPVHSQYDCTGCIFTSWYHLLKWQGDWWVIHHYAMDV